MVADSTHIDYWRAALIIHSVTNTASTHNKSLRREARYQLPSNYIHEHLCSMKV
jgi:hypothetical protein